MGGKTSSATVNTTEEYNGTSWSSGGNLITARAGFAEAGTSSAGLCFGNQSPVGNSTEEYGAGPGSYDELFTASQGL
jgi:hypothetical protein